MTYNKLILLMLLTQSIFYLKSKRLKDENIQIVKKKSVIDTLNKYFLLNGINYVGTLQFYKLENKIST